jgi:phospholipid transport system transporter-binding protein
MFELDKELTLANAMRVAQAGNSAIAQGQTQFDLSPLESVDSSAVAVLLAWQRAAKAGGRAIQFIGFPPDIVSLMTLYGVTDFIQTAE